MNEKLWDALTKTAVLRAALVAAYSESNGAIEILLERFLGQISDVEQKLSRLLRSMPDDNGQKSAE